MELDLPFWVAPTLVVCIVVLGLLSALLVRLAMYIWADGNPGGLAIFAGMLGVAAMILGWLCTIFYVYGVDEPFWGKLFIIGYIVLMVKLAHDVITTLRKGALV